MKNNSELAAMRRNYSLKELDESTVNPDPFIQFELWFNEAVSSEILEANAMILATVSSDSKPTARTVLLKGFDKTGFTFFTNYESKKAKDIMVNPNVSLLFLWKELERQVRINGSVIKVSEEESKKYFESRPLDSRIGAWASAQSSKIVDRKYLEEKFEFYKQKFSDGNIPLSPNWGGYKVIPDYFEFWQGRENRLHDRICYEVKESVWKIYRLSP
ncbi:MAG: pyridoxamine 5'-phosphate oxidase [Ignavibacteriales bacterium]|nr:MAG: pyridoxamine 5'-phosphate oxidase [Ignavibacteriales bacterium]